MDIKPYTAEIVIGTVVGLGAAARRLVKLPKDEFVSTRKKVALAGRDALLAGGGAAGATFGIKKGWAAFGKWAEKNEWARLTERLSKRNFIVEKPVRWTTTCNPGEVAGVHPNGQQLIYSKLVNDREFIETVHIPLEKGYKEIYSTLVWDDLPSAVRAMFT